MFVLRSRSKQPAREVVLPVAGSVWMPPGGSAPLPGVRGGDVGALERELERQGLAAAYYVDAVADGQAVESALPVAEPVPSPGPAAEAPPLLGPVTPKPRRRR